MSTPIGQLYRGARCHGDRDFRKINRLVDYLCPETRKQYNWINTKYISLSSRELHCFIFSHGRFTLLCILGKSIFHSSFLHIINLCISRLAYLRGIYKTLIWVYHSVSLSTLDFGIRYKTLTGKYLMKIHLTLCHPHKPLLM